MAQNPPLTLDQLGVPPEIRERAKMLWLITLVGGLWGWVVCNFVWKVEGQDQNEWYQKQLKQSMIIGGVGWVLSVFMGIGWFVCAVLSFLGFSAIGKGEDYVAPVIGDMILGANIPQVGTSTPAQPQQPQPTWGVAQPQPVPPPQQEPVGRNYDQEEIDDPAGFDLRRDLMGYFIAQREISMAWENTPERDRLFRQYGIRDENHFRQVEATVQRFMASADAARLYGSQEQIMQLQVNAAMEWQKRQQASRAQQMSSELEPVEGVSLQQWAWAQANLAQSAPIDQILGQLQVDRARWDRVSAEWNARMSRDTTATIATEYSKYFTGTGAGQFGATAQAVSNTMNVGSSNEPGGAEPIPFEKFVELAVATEAAAVKGWDVNALLAQHNMNASEWAMASTWWYQKCAARAMDAAFQARWEQLKDWYKAHYLGTSADSDIQY